MAGGRLPVPAALGRSRAELVGKCRSASARRFLVAEIQLFVQERLKSQVHLGLVLAPPAPDRTTGVGEPVGLSFVRYRMGGTVVVTAGEQDPHLRRFEEVLEENGRPMLADRPEFQCFSGIGGFTHEESTFLFSLFSSSGFLNDTTDRCDPTETPSEVHLVLRTRRRKHP